jgi:DNA-binding response OmpR family regulator
VDKKKILIVDDEQDALSVLEKTLTIEGYSVITATSAKSLSAALLLEEPKLPDLIILDLALPDIHGREIAAKLKENPKTKDIPVLFLSALYSKRQEAEIGHILDGNVMFSKPYDIEKLGIAIKRLLTGKKKILIVDDEMDVLSVLEKGLTTEEYSVIKADKGKDALVLAKSERPDLIILDLEMPDMYGGDITRMLKEEPETKDIPVMFLTGMFPKEEEKDGRVVAGHMLFTKPYDIKGLVTAIKRLL